MIMIIKMSFFCTYKVKKKDVGLSSYRIYNKKDHHFENLSLEESDAFINLNNNENIIIQKADKGNTVVIIDQANFIREMENILLDANKFLKVTLWESKTRVTSYEFKSMSYKFKSTSHEFKSTNYDFKSTIYEFKSTSSRIIKSMKTRVNSLKSSSFPKAIIP